MVLATITVLTVLLTEFQDESSAELSGAVSDRDALKAEYLARSGINLARLLIASEPTIRTAVAPLFMMMRTTPPQIPVWEFSDRVLGAFNDQTGAEEFNALAGVNVSEGKNLGIEGGKFELVIVDEDSKINVNLAARGDAFSQTRMATQLMGLMLGEQYNPLFEEKDADGQFSDRMAICGALIDWADPDEGFYNCDPRASAVAAAAAAEDSFYQLLEPPYRRKNAAFDSLDELRLVRGMGEDFWATFVDPEPGNPKKRVLTVWGQGQVNVNTANAQTIWAIVCAAAEPQTPLCTDATQASGFIQMVSLMRGFSQGAPLFANAKQFVRTMKGKGLLGPMLTATNIQPVQFMSDAETVKMVATESKVFSIYADGVVPGYRRETRVRIHAVVDFRSAPAPGFGAAGFGKPAEDDDEETTSDSKSSDASGAAAENQLGENALAGALAPNPAGTIVYFRVE
jgi:general secretion pathway protein K